MEELILRVLGVSTWLIMAMMGYGLFIHGFRKWGKVCLTISLTALSVMALQPWGANQAVFDAIAPEHGHSKSTPSSTTLGTPELEISHSLSEQVNLNVVEGTKLGEIYLKPSPRPGTGRPVVSSFH